MIRGELGLIACESGRGFAARVERNLRDLLKDEDKGNNFKIKDTEEVNFPNGEIKTVINASIRGNDIYIIQCVDDPLSDRSVNDNLMALVTAIDAVYQSDADHVTAVMPQFPYSRQERKKTREGVTAKQVALILENAGADDIITLDIHAEAIGGFFNKANLEDLHASTVIIDYFKKRHFSQNLVVVAPDVGGAEKARHYSKRLEVDFAIVDKARDYSQPSTVERMRLVGEVKDVNVLIVDDMIGTGGTLINAAQLLKDKGAKDIYVVCSLPFFNEKAVEKLAKAYKDEVIKTIIGTDAVFWGERFVSENPWYEEVSVGTLFAKVIYNLNHRESVSALLR